MHSLLPEICCLMNGFRTIMGVSWHRGVPLNIIARPPVQCCGHRVEKVRYVSFSASNPKTNNTKFPHWNTRLREFHRGGLAFVRDQSPLTRLLPMNVFIKLPTKCRDYRCNCGCLYVVLGIMSSS